MNRDNEMFLSKKPENKASQFANRVKENWVRLATLPAALAAAVTLNASPAMAACESDINANCHTFIIMNQANLGAAVGNITGGEFRNTLQTIVLEPTTTGWLEWRQRDGKSGFVQALANNGVLNVETFIVNPDNTVTTFAGDLFNNGTNEDGLNLPASSGQVISPITGVVTTTVVQPAITVNTPSGNINVPVSGRGAVVNIATGGNATGGSSSVTVNGVAQ